MIGVVASDPARYGVDTIQLRQLTRMLQAIEGELLDGRIYLVRWHPDTCCTNWWRASLNRCPAISRCCCGAQNCIEQKYDADGVVVVTRSPPLAAEALHAITQSLAFLDTRIGPCRRSQRHAARTCTAAKTLRAHHLLRAALCRRGQRDGPSPALRRPVRPVRVLLQAVQAEPGQKVLQADLHGPQEGSARPPPTAGPATPR